MKRLALQKRKVLVFPTLCGIGVVVLREKRPLLPVSPRSLRKKGRELHLALVQVQTATKGKDHLKENNISV